MHDIVLHCASYTLAMPCHTLPGEVHGVAPARCFTSLEGLLADDELDIVVRWILSLCNRCCLLTALRFAVLWHVICLSQATMGSLIISWSLNPDKDSFGVNTLHFFLNCAATAAQYLLSPPSHHASQCKACLDSGRHVMCEQPSAPAAHCREPLRAHDRQARADVAEL